MEMLLWPEQNHLQRDLGLVLARCGLVAAGVDLAGPVLAEQPGRPAEAAVDGIAASAVELNADSAITNGTNADTNEEDGRITIRFGLLLFRRDIRAIRG